MHIFQAAGSQRGRAADPLLQPQVCVCGSLQHRHSASHKHSQDNAGESNQGQLNSIIPIINTLHFPSPHYLLLHKCVIFNKRKEKEKSKIYFCR